MDLNPLKPSGAAAFPETLGGRLVRLRKARQLTQRDIARQLGVAVTSVCYWEQDRSRPKPARLRRLADVLGTPLADLNGLGGPPQSAHLGELVAQARREIAEAAGTTPAKVKIIIEM
ncbi:MULTISPECIES: helix-turn-helix domain-containing protein [Sphingopyxis]|jgi:transcriptional regulator with XRE-family HTH domain|uniref:helix-turn-helix domain-containing protein n=2 Tax=Sphingomonadaceae TaxID=41297 RepID=UPI0019C9CE65|nr:helix-turn-helix transcriptional regulator [Sphingopyxis sp.]MBD3747617.1 helix-turn-helix transcriptional regulator [Sphingopyxis terrae]